MNNTLFASGNNMGTAARMVVFEAVVREGGFTAAARVLGVSKANVSRQVSELESSLGVRLLQRTTRVVRPTEAGSFFFERCVEVVRLVQEAGGLLSSIQEEVVGRLRVSIPVSFGQAFLDDPIASFVQRFPRLDVEVDVSDRPVDLLQGDYDLAIRVGAVTQPDLVVRKICKTRRLVVGAPALVRRVGPVDSPEVLSTQPCLLYAHQVPKDKWLFRGDKGTLAVPVSGKMRSSSGDFLAAMACRGLGFAWLPDFIVAKYLADGRLESLFDDRCHDAMDVQAVLPARKHLPLKVREFIDHLHSRMAAGG
ncbi:MAG: LysR family transcriptional regulator [Myxococcales bacterium]|nr:LysR family transcriptional regulator [Myxococcales bacterium]